MDWYNRFAHDSTSRGPVCEDQVYGGWRRGWSRKYARPIHHPSIPKPMATNFVYSFQQELQHGHYPASESMEKLPGWWRTANFEQAQRGHVSLFHFRASRLGLFIRHARFLRYTPSCIPSRFQEWMREGEWKTNMLLDVACSGDPVFKPRTVKSMQLLLEAARSSWLDPDQNGVHVLFLLFRNTSAFM